MHLKVGPRTNKTDFVCVFVQEADGEDRLGLGSEGEGDMEGECKADTPDMPPTSDDTPQCLNKALEGLSSR